MRTILILAGIYVFWRIISRYLLLRRFIRQQFEQQQQNSNPPGKEGDVRIINEHADPRNKRDIKGEYVDYEEL